MFSYNHILKELLEDIKEVKTSIQEIKYGKRDLGEGE